MLRERYCAKGAQTEGKVPYDHSISSYLCLGNSSDGKFRRFLIYYVPPLPTSPNPAGMEVFVICRGASNFCSRHSQCSRRGCTSPRSNLTDQSHMSQGGSSTSSPRCSLNTQVCNRNPRNNRSRGSRVAIHTSSRWHLRRTNSSNKVGNKTVHSNLFWQLRLGEQLVMTVELMLFRVRRPFRTMRVRLVPDVISIGKCETSIEIRSRIRWSSCERKKASDQRSCRTVVLGMTRKKKQIDHSGPHDSYLPDLWFFLLRSIGRL